jgi:tRNA pseudouridine38-40 synthase
VPALRRRLEAREAGLATAALTPLPVFRITLAYDGTDFLGWQLQRRGAGRTVQGVLEDALARLVGGRRVVVSAAGRTDAGVHALGQVASFDLSREHEPLALAVALNGLLPPDVRVLAAALAPAGFHARRSARSKLYRYVLDCGGVPLPQRRRFAGWVPWRLDPESVQAVAALYAGRHDFAALASSGGSTRTSERTVTRSDVAFDDCGLTYEVEADGFLRRMVRSMVGGLVAAGRGAASIATLRAALEGRDRQAWPAPAAARGLTLVCVDYPPDPDAVLP